MCSSEQSVRSQPALRHHTVIETSNSIFNMTLYKAVVPQSLWAWQRVRLASMAAADLLLVRLRFRSTTLVRPGRCIVTPIVHAVLLFLPPGTYNNA